MRVGGWCVMVWWGVLCCAPGGSQPWWQVPTTHTCAAASAAAGTPWHQARCAYTLGRTWYLHCGVIHVLVVRIREYVLLHGRKHQHIRAHIRTSRESMYPHARPRLVGGVDQHTRAERHSVVFTANSHKDCVQQCLRRCTRVLWRRRPQEKTPGEDPPPPYSCCTKRLYSYSYTTSWLHGYTASWSIGPPSARHDLTVLHC